MLDKQQKIIVVSGLSGAGKSVALQSLEDMGFYCIDNLPLTLLPEFARQFEATSKQFKQAAVSIDSRNLDFLSALQAQDLGTDFLSEIDQLIFIEAQPETLIRRYSETRRKHPLSGLISTLTQSIKQEISLLEPLRQRASQVIDTSQLTPHELREQVRLSVGKTQQGVMLAFESFGFKHGPPSHADFIFDVRCLPNPYWEEDIRHLNGTDEDIIKFLESKPKVIEMCDDIEAFVAKWLPAFEADNRSYLTIAVGCTGGRHRSVYTVSQLANRFKQVVKNVQVQHRDL
ncbi:MAG: RNase adapter RapZ [Arenicellales bacterium]